MPWINTAEQNPLELSPDETLQVYNGFDNLLTWEILQKLLTDLDETTARTYLHELSLQGPVLDMMTSGVCIEMKARDDLRKELRSLSDQIAGQLRRMVDVSWPVDLRADHPCYVKRTRTKKTRALTKRWREFVEFNPRSDAQIMGVLYDWFGCERRYNFDPKTKRRSLTVDRKALEALYHKHYYVKPIISCILTIRTLEKLLEVLVTEVDPDCRMRCTWKVSGTETGRFSSSKTVFDTGRNLQNITLKVRRIFVADDGWKLAYCDLQQAESRVVGLMVWALFSDRTYLDACEGSDLHSAVAKMAWPELAWTGDPEANNALARTPYYRHFSYRDMAKKAGHATSYRISARHLAKDINIPEKVAREFQERYLAGFSGIRLWQDWIITELQSKGFLTSLLGRRRHFLGRLSATETIYKATAYIPQSTIGDGMNWRMRELWKWGLEIPDLFQLLLNQHDGVIFQYRASEEEQLLSRAEEFLALPVHCGDKSIIIPVDTQVGWNWAKYDEEKNPDGLVQWNREVPDNRTRMFPAQTSLLHRSIR